MKSSSFRPSPTPSGSPGRPFEVEEATNRYLVHPVSRKLVDALVHTPVTPNQVSVASVFAAAAGAYALWALAWPWGPCAGLLGLFVWHVLDGADGDLARRTGRASVSGELVDGICDHVSQILVYVALALVLQRTLQGWAWVLACVAGVSHFVQANVYETGRKTYRRWVYGAAWMRQGFAGANSLQKALSGLYLGISSLANPGDVKVEKIMAAALAKDADAARQTYAQIYAPLVKGSAILSSNSRTLAVFAAMIAGSGAPAGATLSRSGNSNRMKSWNTAAMRLRHDAMSKSRKSTPSTSIVPA